MARYFWRDGKFVDRDGVEMEMPFEGQICAPAVMSDIPEYPSPIDDRMITSRSHRREDLKRNNCFEYEPSMSPTKGKFRNPAFCKKHGLQISEEYR
jgi:hypothetical protein